MATRTVRLDEESERALAEIRLATGATVSRSFKQGLFILRDTLRARFSATPYEDLPVARSRARRLFGGAGTPRQGCAPRAEIDLADASLVVAAETLRTNRVFTLDRNDFATYRAVIGRTSRRFSVLG
jgi:hypothetical protein